MRITSLILAKALAVSGFCPNPIIDDQTKNWTPADEQALIYAVQGCIQRYGPYACVKKITKTEEQSYQVICMQVEDK